MSITKTIYKNKFGQRKRGPQKKQVNTYIHDAHKSIAELRAQLHGHEKTLTGGQKRSLRNRISAFQARINQKLDMTFLKDEIKMKDEKMSKLITVLKEFVGPKDLPTFTRKLQWDDNIGCEKNIDELA